MSNSLKILKFIVLLMGITLILGLIYFFIAFYNFSKSHFGSCNKDAELNINKKIKSISTKGDDLYILADRELIILDKCNLKVKNTINTK